MQAISKKINVKICIGNCCYIKGAPALFKTIEEQNKMSQNLEISVTPAFCLENCLAAPSIMIDNMMYSDVNPKNLIEIINDIMLNK